MLLRASPSVPGSSKGHEQVEAVLGGSAKDLVRGPKVSHEGTLFQFLLTLLMPPGPQHSGLRTQQGGS